jgi:hypothetical protein
VGQNTKKKKTKGEAGKHAAMVWGWDGVFLAGGEKFLVA